MCIRDSYDEKGNLQKELKTQQKILFDEFTWQNDGYIHYFADGKLYRLDTNTMKLSNVCPYDCLLYTSARATLDEIEMDEPLTISPTTTIYEDVYKRQSLCRIQ